MKDKVRENTAQIRVPGRFLGEVRLKDNPRNTALHRDFYASATVDASAGQAPAWTEGQECLLPFRRHNQAERAILAPGCVHYGIIAAKQGIP